MLFIFSLYILFRGAIFLFATSFLGEILVSFLPYMIAGDLVVLIFIGARLLTKTKKTLSPRLLVVLQSLVLVGSGIYAAYTSSRFVDTDYSSTNTTNITNTSGGLSFRYANIYKNNTNYKDIQTSIEQVDPDVVFLVEYEQHHHDALSGFFVRHYPYQNRDVSTRQYFGNMIFSKYPLTDLTNTIEQIPRRYGFVNIQKGQQSYLFYLIHTSAPISPAYFDQRNKQLPYLAKQITLHQKRFTHKPIVLIGDFNTSPRSVYYKKFTDALPVGFTNISDRMSMTTRCKMGLPFACVNIDHIFINTQASVAFEKFFLPGSDHRGFAGRIK